MGWRLLIGVLRARRWRWGALGVATSVAALLGLAGPLVIRRALDDAVAGTTAGHVAALAALFLAIAIADRLINVVAAWIATVAAWNTTNEMRVDLTAHVLGLDHHFHRTHTPGELIQRVDGDVTHVADFLSMVLPRLISSLITIAGTVIVLAVIDWRLGAGMAAFVAVAFTVVAVFRHSSVAEADEEMQSNAIVYGGIEERLTAAQDLRTAGAVEYALWRHAVDSAGATRTAVRREYAFLRMWWGFELAMAFGWGGSVAIGGWLVARGAIGVGTAFLLFQYVVLISRPLHDLIDQLEVVQRATGAMRRVMALMSTRSTLPDEGTIDPPAGAFRVEFDDVSFDYGDGDPVLETVNLEIASGRRVGVVGRTGSGKTTLSRLVLRLVDPSAGTIRLNGVAMPEIPLATLRDRIALVPQEVELFAGTVRDNVTLFDPRPSDEDVVAALRAVGLERLTGRLDERLGDRGSGMSAGEAQLIALARVWIRRPDLIVLDEATARIDPETERNLAAAIDAVTAGRTTFVIAHRLSTLRAMDEIVVIEEGRIVEHGDRDALEADPQSRYAHLLRRALEHPEEVA